jgi:S-adenosylmethionine:tRNA ribosyltransferase-isomerase
VARDGGLITLRFNCGGGEFRARLATHGHAPLPPYIPREKGTNAADLADYQTVYAQHEGAVAAPTAGLHITHDMLAALKAKGVICVFLTLHVGAGTFLPVKSDDTDNHRMHAESGILDQAAADTINDARASGGRVVAVGTTSLRLLESAAREDGTLAPIARDVDLFILPGYRFKTVDLLLTNFHLPRSTLFMLVSAFAGRERMLAAYEHAIAKEYRFYSYGDACLLRRAAS